MPDRPADDPRALVGRLYDRHGAALYRYAAILLGDAAAAEDAIHQVFSGLLRRPVQLNDETHYLRRAVRNECYTMLRRRRRESQADRPLLEPVVGHDVGPDERIALEGALRALPPEQREVVHLHVYEGLTFREVADAQDVSINTVTARYRYALAKLRETFSRTERP